MLYRNRLNLIARFLAWVRWHREHKAALAQLRASLKDYHR